MLFCVTKQRQIDLSSHFYILSSTLVSCEKGKMPLDPAKKTAIGEVIDALLGMQAPRGKRLLCGMFMDLVDRADWPQYYEVKKKIIFILVWRVFCVSSPPSFSVFCLLSVFLFLIFDFYVDVFFWTFFFFGQVIPEPRCINNIKVGLEKGRYKESLDVYTDLSLVFWNALFYNEPGSQIALDAETLKVCPAGGFYKHAYIFLLFWKESVGGGVEEEGGSWVSSSCIAAAFVSAEST